MGGRARCVARTELMRTERIAAGLLFGCRTAARVGPRKAPCRGCAGPVPAGERPERVTHRRTTPRWPGDTSPAACGAHTLHLDRATHSTLNPLLARADPRGLLHRVDTQRITSAVSCRGSAPLSSTTPVRRRCPLTENRSIGGPPDVRPTGVFQACTAGSRPG